MATQAQILQHVLGGAKAYDLGGPPGVLGDVMEAYFFGADTLNYAASGDMTMTATASPTATVSASAGGISSPSMTMTAAAVPTAAVAAVAASGDMTMTAAAVPAALVASVAASGPMTMGATARRATGGLYTSSDLGRGYVVKNAKAAPVVRPAIPIDRKHTDDATSKFSREVRDSLKTISDSPIPWGRLVTVEFETANTPVEVKGPPDRAVVGYIVVGLSADATIFEADPPNSHSRGSIWLQSSAFVRAKLWIF